MPNSDEATGINDLSSLTVILSSNTKPSRHMPNHPPHCRHHRSAPHSLPSNGNHGHKSLSSSSSTTAATPTANTITLPNIPTGGSIHAATHTCIQIGEPPADFPTACVMRCAGLGSRGRHWVRKPAVVQAALPPRHARRAYIGIEIAGPEREGWRRGA